MPRNRKEVLATTTQQQQWCTTPLTSYIPWHDACWILLISNWTGQPIQTKTSWTELTSGQVTNRTHPWCRRRFPVFLFEGPQLYRGVPRRGYPFVLIRVHCFKRRLINVRSLIQFKLGDTPTNVVPGVFGLNAIAVGGVGGVSGVCVFVRGIGCAR